MEGKPFVTRTPYTSRLLFTEKIIQRNIYFRTFFCILGSLTKYSMMEVNGTQLVTCIRTQEDLLKLYLFFMLFISRTCFDEFLSLLDVA